ncbi:hypothetical protein DFJ73DRAFT_799542 [Zopfochytrium polystomum]|nr:hypothetical protein DFJ73DRAFT_799542 [Zopfochytrium polystomum]
MMQPSPRSRSPAFVPLIAEQICRAVSDPRERFVLATLHRLPALQAAGILSIPMFFVANGPSAVRASSSSGDVEALQWWKEKWDLHRGDAAIESIFPQYTVADAIAFASESGSVAVLQWWKESGLQLTYFARVMDGASVRGRLEVLDWWKSSELALRYSELSMDSAAKLASDEEAVSILN